MLGKFLHNPATADLARAIFQPSFIESHQLLHDTIDAGWSKETIIRAILQGDNLAMLKKVSQDKEMHMSVARIEHMLATSSLPATILFAKEKHTESKRLAAQLDFGARLLNDGTTRENVTLTKEESKVTLPWPVALTKDPKQRTLWFRINGAALLGSTLHGTDAVFQEKLQRFYNAHLSGEYVPLGPSLYSVDRDFFKFEHEMHRLHQEPKSILQISVEDVLDSNVEWTPTLHGVWTPCPEAVVETHAIYLACVHVLNKLHADGSPLAWRYYAGFTDLFSHCVQVNKWTDAYLLTPIGASNERGASHIADLTGMPTPWELYGTAIDTRAFHAGDLPDLLHVLVNIPLHGIQKQATCSVAKLMHKALPFACQRRHVYTYLVECIKTEPNFWDYFSRLMWTMLADLYPERRNPALTMQHLVRTRALIGNQETCINALAEVDPGKNGAPLLALTAFRLHIVYMASFSAAYTKHASMHLDWPGFCASTREMHLMLLSQSTWFTIDPFAEARGLLSRTVKNPRDRVLRLRKRTMARTIADYANEVLEKTLVRDKHVRGATNPDIAAYYEEVFNMTGYRGRVLNALLKVDPLQRMTRDTIHRIAPELSSETLDLVGRLCNVYYSDIGTPNQFRTCFDDMDVRECVLLTFYVNTVSTLEKIRFVELDADTVERVDQTMINNKHFLRPGERVPENIYDVHISLCCLRVCTIIGTGRHGSVKVAYDTEKQTYVCAKGKELTADDDDDDDDDDDGDEQEPVEEVAVGRVNIRDFIDQQKTNKRSPEMEQRRSIRTERKCMNRLPCNGRQPVLTINLRGRALIWNDNTRYAHCPTCAGLYTGLECVECNPPPVECKRCAYCRIELVRSKNVFTLRVKDVNATCTADIFSSFYFCARHFLLARMYSHKLLKHNLWKKIAAIERRRLLRNAARN